MKKKNRGRKSTKRTKTKKNSMKRAKQRPRATVRGRGNRAVKERGSGSDKAWLTIEVTGVEGGGAEAMSFTASALGESVSFSEGVGVERNRILYDGPYFPGPYHITVTGREYDPSSDDEFTEGSADLSVDLSTLQGTASVTISQKPGDKDDTDVGDEPNDPDDPDEEASYTISFLAEVEPAVSVLTADVKNNNIVVQLSPDGANGILTLTLKGLNGAEKEIYSEQASGGTVQETFHFDEFTPADGEMTLTQLEATWDVGAPVAAEGRRTNMAKKSRGVKAKGPVKPRVESDFYNITKYFTPRLEAYPQDDLVTVGTGVYADKSREWTGLHDEQYPSEFLNSLRDVNEGLGLIGNTVVRLHYTHGQKGGTPYRKKLYLSNPDPDQQTGSCKPDHNIIGTADTIASRDKNLLCGARIMIDGIDGIMTKRDKGKLPRHEKQIDVYIGEGGPEKKSACDVWGEPLKHVVQLLGPKSRS
jgi:hypothetical protein